MWKSIVIFLLALTSVNCSRVIGGDPKTWSPQLVSELDCATCKVLIATLETDACLKCPNTTMCTDFIEKYGDPTRVCQQLDICPKKSWFYLIK